MDKTGQDLLKLMFDPGECVAVSNCEFGFHSIPLENALSGQITLLSPNDKVPIKYCDSSEITLVAINPINGFRRDENVQKFRTFLFEIDIGSIPEQLGYFKQIGVPLSAQIFSGNRSVHALTVLDQDLPDEKTYRTLYQWALNILQMCDQNCKNGSRSCRVPGAYREPGKKQRLIKLAGRVKLKDFMDWLNKYEHLRPKGKEKKVIPEGHGDFSRLTPWVCGMLKTGMRFDKGRNQTWYAVAMDFALAGYSEESTIEELGKRFEEESDFREKEWLTTIASAFKSARERD